MFSPDSKHLAYVAVRDLMEFVVSDDREGPAYAAIKWHAFSADGRHLAYVAFPTKRRHDAVMVVDGLVGPVHRQIWIPKDFEKHPRTLRYVVSDYGKARLIEVDWPVDRDWTAGLTPAKP